MSPKATKNRRGSLEDEEIPFFMRPRVKFVILELFPLQFLESGKQFSSRKPKKELNFLASQKNHKKLDHLWQRKASSKSTPRGKKTLPPLIGPSGRRRRSHKGDEPLF